LSCENIWIGARVPPTANDDAATWENAALKRPDLVWIVYLVTILINSGVELHHRHTLKAVNALLGSHGMDATEEMTMLATASPPELLDLRLLDFLGLSRTRSPGLLGTDLRKRVAAYDLFPLLWPRERVIGFAFFEKESHILQQS